MQRHQEIGRVRRRHSGNTIWSAARFWPSPGLILFATSFLLQNPVPLTVRASVVIFIAVGIAISAGLLRVQNPQDVYGGMALILLALIAFVASNDLPGMRGFAFGPGTAPRLFAFTLAHCRSVSWSAAC